MIVYSVLFVLSFVTIVICMYYLSALALNSFETSSLFTFTLVLSSLVVIASIWGCHRAKESRDGVPDPKYMGAKTRNQKHQLSLIFFFILFALFVSGNILLAVNAHQNFELLTTLANKPVDYWFSHPGPEATMLHNFALEFDQMWQAGQCSGNNCVVPDCADSPIQLTPFNCTDKSMETEFEKWSTRSPPSETELRKCVVYVNSLFGGPSSNTTFPVVTWCECRSVLINYARISNWLIFLLLVIGVAVITVFIVPLVTLQRVLLRKVDNEVSLAGGRGTDWFSYRIALSRSRIDWPRRQEDP
jgi:hypothetical protein